MKKNILILLSVFSIATAAYADNYKTVPVNQLPAKAQTFVSTYFSGVKVALSRQEMDVFEKTFDVIFADGRKVEFNHKGEWTEVDGARQEVPAGIVPQSVADYVKVHYPDATINKIERDHKEVEVQLSNHVELTFNKKMQLIDID